jgi:hypothetical protein
MDGGIMDLEFWRKCSTCKKPIYFNKPYYVCSVSTCNGQRTGYVFCNITCFEAHLPGARHRDAGAVEKIAPRTAEAAVSPSVSLSVSSSTPTQSSRPLQQNQTGGAMSTNSTKPNHQEVLIVASRLKDYITARSGYNTSQSVMDVLSDHIRVVCERAMEQARNDGRKTVMDRDFSFLKNLK